MALPQEEGGASWYSSSPDLQLLKPLGALPLPCKLGKKSMTQTVGEEVNLSAFKWNYLILFPFTIEPYGGYKSSSIPNKLYVGKKLVETMIRSRNCVYNLLLTGSGRVGVCFPPS